MLLTIEEQVVIVATAAGDYMHLEKTQYTALTG